MSIRSENGAANKRNAGAPSAATRPLPFEVVEQKIRVPVLRSDLVSRTALVNQLRANVDAPIISVLAPVGYGKTTVLAQWAERDSRPFAWISIDEQDDDPVVLVRHLAAALDAVTPLSPDLLHALAGPLDSVWTTVVPQLASAIAAAGPLVVVLDDVHMLRSVESVEVLGAVADHVINDSVLVVAGSATPRLPIAAFRAAGRLMEIGVADLALTPREAQRLLRTAGVSLEFDDVTRLVRECEGWAAAVYLAGLALRAGQEDGPLPAPTPRSADREAGLASYLRSEYLSRLPPRTVQFLRRTSVLDRMCGSLCDSMLGAEGSTRELEHIERSNLFLVPLDRHRGWYRYHRLFRDVLRRELAAREPNLVGILHARAADWYEANGQPEAALEHAHARGDTRRAARILSAIAVPVYHSGRGKTVERWLERFDDPKLLARYPAVALKGSWLFALLGRGADAERWLGVVETSLAAQTSRPTAAQRAWLTLVRAALCRDGVYQMIADAESSLADMRRDEPARAFAVMLLASGYMLLGQSERADALFATAAQEAARLGATDTRVAAIGERSLLAAAHNDLPAAQRLATDAEHLTEDGHLEDYGTTAIAVAAAARASLRRGNWTGARADLAKLRELMPSVRSGPFPWFAIQAQLEFARAYLALRDIEAVESLLVEIRSVLREHPHLGTLVGEVEALERDLAATPADANVERTLTLTPAELRLLPYLATHLSFREIGEELYVSRNTIKTQAISVYRKLGVTSRSEAIASAARLGLVDPSGYTS
ncbi:MAG: LuxR C-terminal-related transcriptional regulator [Gaiellaceae bacterium]